MDNDQKRDRADRPRTEPITGLAALSVAGGLAAIVAEGTLAKFLAIPLAIAIAWAVVLTSRRSRRRLDPFGHDRMLTAAIVLALLLGSGVVACSIKAGEHTTVVFAPVRAPSAGGQAATRKTSATRVRGYAPSARPAYECVLHSGACEAGVDHVVFNSYINTPNYGDERPFVDAKPAGDQSRDGYRDRLSVNPGDKITLRVYIDNNADTLPAHDTELMVLLQKTRARRLLAAGSISATNATPRVVSDTVEFNSAQPISLQFDRTERPQVTFRPTPTRGFETKVLPSAYFPDRSVLTAHLGTWPAGFAAGAVITAAVLVI